MNDMTAHLDVTEMAEAVAGGPDALAARRWWPATRTRVPLVHNAEAVRTCSIWPVAACRHLQP